LIISVRNITVDSKLKFAIYLLNAVAVFLLCTGELICQSGSLKAKQDAGKPIIINDRRDISNAVTPFRAPPSGPVHCCAEWEESEGVMALWWNWDLMDKLQANIPVYIPVDSNSEKNQWINHLNSHGVPLTNISFLFIQTNSIYTRDYGPWFIWDSNNDMGIVNYTCSYGVQDDLFPSVFANKFSINYYESGLEHVGGNYYPNGYGRAFSTTRVYTDNGGQIMPLTDQAMNDYFGIENYHTVVVSPITIEHHDCWGKPANPETLIIDQFDEDSEYYPYGEGMAAHYETLESPWGRPYKILRLPMFKMGSPGYYEFKPYMNSLICNKKVYMAICNHPHDQIAIDVFKKAFPGYEIIGVDHMGCGWTDALHCRTRNFVKRDALRLYPYPPGDTEDTLTPYTVIAEAIPPNGAVIDSGYPKLWWTETGSGPFNEVIMPPTGNPNEYSGQIPPRAHGTTVSFYIEAKDDRGQYAIYPMVAPDGMMSFDIRTDNDAPVLSRNVATRSACVGQWPCKVRTLCKDDIYTPKVELESFINNIPQPSVDLTRENLCYWYSGKAAGAVSQGDLLTYRLTATDNAAVPNISYYPKVGHVCCPVVGKNESVAVVDLSKRPASGPFIAKTLGDLGIHFTYYTEWPDDFTDHNIWFFCLSIFADNYILSSSEAADIVSALQSGDSIYMESGDSWCYDSEKDTIAPMFGVSQDNDGQDMPAVVRGQPSTILSGLEFVYAGVNAYVDEISAVSPATVLIRSDGDNEGRTVSYNAGGYKTIASSFTLGGLTDSDWPEQKKNLLLHYLEFFDFEPISLYSTGPSKTGETTWLHLDGDPADEYILFASLAEDYLPCKYGAFRLSPKYMFIIEQGVIPSSGTAMIDLFIPRIEYLEGHEIHLQALVAESLKPNLNVELTNRQILTIEP